MNYFLNYSKVIGEIPTPAIIWSEEKIINNIRLYKLALENQEIEIRYAVKACALKLVLETVRAEGCGVDCQSVMEAELSLKAGIDFQKITLNSPRLREEEISWAIQNKIKVICDSKNQIEIIDKLVSKLQFPKDWRYGVRVSLPIEETKRFHSKLGMDTSEILFGLEKVNPKTLSLLDEIHHHGAARETNSCLLSKVTKELGKLANLIENKFSVRFQKINLGSGLDSQDIIKEAGNDLQLILHECCSHLKEQIDTKNRIIVFEPGRAIVQNSAIGLTKVISKKRIWGKDIIVVDISTNVLIPSPLEKFCVWHPNFNKSKTENLSEFVVVDGTCSPTGVIVESVKLPTINEGDMLWIGLSGAYTWSLAQSFYDYIPSAWWLDKQGVIKQIVDRENNKKMAFYINGFENDMI